MSSSSSTTTTFPIGSRVILTNLTKAPQYNNKVGIVQSSPSNVGRQQVKLVDTANEKEEGDKNKKQVIALKPCNLKYEPRSVESLSVKECKIVLESIHENKKNNSNSSASNRNSSDVNVNERLAGMDKQELKKLVKEMVVHDSNDDSEVTIASILAHHSASTTTSTTTTSTTTTSTTTNNNNNTTRGGGNFRQQFQTQANALNNMSSSQFKQQAAAMRAMDPNTIRRMMPGMANFTDQQLQMAIMQMEQMADNPDMVKNMVNEMNNLSDSELENVSNVQHGLATPPTVPTVPTTSTSTTSSHTTSSSTATTTTATTATGTATTPSSTNQTFSQSNISTGLNQMANLSPTQLSTQAQMMKSMPKSQLRSLNPAMANWSDAQIDFSIAQMENMASNPEMLRGMMDQVKNLKEEDLAKVSEMAKSGNLGGLENLGGATTTSTTPTSTSGAQGTTTGAQGTTEGMPTFDPNNMDPMQFLQNTSPSQIKSMLNMVKSNPSIMKQMLQSTNPQMAQSITDEQLDKMMSTLDKLDEQKIGWIVKALGVWTSIKGFWNRGGGKGFLVLVLAVGIYSFIRYFVLNDTSNEGGNVIVDTNVVGQEDSIGGGGGIPDMGESTSSSEPIIQEDEFGNEF